MATVSAPNRSIIAIIFLVGGALQILGALVGLANIGNAGGFYLLSNLAIGAGFVLLLTWYSSTTVARAGFFIAALGWLLLALTSLINLGAIGSVALYIAVVGSVFAAVVVLLEHTFRSQADVVFVVAMIVGAVNLVLSPLGEVPALIKVPLVLAFGALLVVFSLMLLGRKLPSPAR